ncbi:TPA: hypothetical protein QFM54_001858 [Enterococcus faecium]
MLGKKWNHLTSKYEAIILPDKATKYSSDLDSLIECAQCKNEIKYSDAYSSLRIQDELGFGFMVCRECMEIELTEEAENKKRKKRL